MMDTLTNDTQQETDATSNPGLRGLQYAKDLTFSQETYDKALKLTDCPKDANSLLKAMLEVSAQGQSRTRVCDKESTNSSTIASSSEKDLLSSCYSSFAPSNVPSSSDQSLDSLPGTTGQVSQLRKIYIDGSNIARTHGKDSSFSWQGIKICLDWFMRRQHKVKVFVPIDRCNRAMGDPIADSVMSYLTNLDALVKTPAGSNDDYYVIEAARHNAGVIVSNDLFRDEKRFNQELQEFIHLNRLPYVFVDDLFIPANDPRGRSGPTLDEFLTCDVLNTNGLGIHSTHYSRVNRPRSYQRYQRGAVSLKNCRSNYASNSGNKLNNNLQRRSLQLTRSLPIDQMETPVSMSPDTDLTHRTSQLAGPLISFDEPIQSNIGLGDRYRRQQVKRVLPGQVARDSK